MNPTDPRPDRQAIATVFDYHERTKHHPHRYARSLGFLDWSSQPSPFRRFIDAPYHPLPLPDSQLGPAYGPLVDGGAPSLHRGEAGVDRHHVSRLFYHSLALSAWKSVPGARWSLRVNPSSGNLHPTESYLLGCPDREGGASSGVWHYDPLEHGLELRRALADEAWFDFVRGTPFSCFIALSSIHWREAWKYGERAYRYCQLDLGHAVAAVAFSASILGWRAVVVEELGDEEIARLLALPDDPQEGEVPGSFLGLMVGSGRNARHGRERDGGDAGATPAATSGGTQFADGGLATPWPAGDSGWRLDLPSSLLEGGGPPLGTPNRLSRDHHRWPVIDAVAGAASKPPLPPRAFVRWPGFGRSGATGGEHGSGPVAERPPEPAETVADASAVVRGRRSALGMDPRAVMDRSVCARILRRLEPRRAHPVFGAWPWPPAIDLVLFIHRVDGLAPGLYWFDRTAAPAEEARRAIRRDAAWEPVPGIPNLHLLLEGDLRAVAGHIACGQSIASDGVFAVAMLAWFDETIQRRGAWFYRRLHWEAGMVGQMLYLEAEAAGMRGTGIGCFFDDEMHRLLGVEGRTLASLYHFTVGKPVPDERLRTEPAYSHRKSI